MNKKAAIIICFNAWNEISTNVTIDFLKSIIEKTDYPDYEIIIYENNSKIDLFKKIFDYINGINNICIKMISPVNKVWYNMDREYNDATKITDAEIFIFANNDMKVINREWLTNVVKWLENDSIGMVCPHTNITYGNFFNCKECLLDKRQRKEIEERNKEEKKGKKGREIKYYSCLFTEGCTRRFQNNSHVLWYREWPSMGIYACTRRTLEKIGMHDTNMDLHGQDMSIMLRFENAGFKITVAMDSLIEHYGDTGHLTLDYIARDGSDDYDFRSIHSYKQTYDYLKQNPHILDIHLPLKAEWDKWYNDFYINPNSSFKRKEYNKWVELHKDDWSTDTRYGSVTVVIICTLQKPEFTELTINAIESILNSDIRGPGMEKTEIIIYENNSDKIERAKFFEYINKKKLNTDIIIKWISVMGVGEKFNINKVYNRLNRFTKNEVMCYANHDIEVINKDWLKNATHWMLRSDYRDKIGILLTSAHESVPARHDNIRTNPEHILKGCGDTPMPIFFVKKYLLERVGGFDEDFAFQYADGSLYCRFRDKGLETFCARDVLIKHYEGRPVNNPKGDSIQMTRNLESRTGRDVYQLFIERYGKKL